MSSARGPYLPPAKRPKQRNNYDWGTKKYQRLNWERLRRSVRAAVNKVHVTNVDAVMRELQRENVLRGKGLLARELLAAQARSPRFTRDYAALVSAVNAKFPPVGALVVHRLVIRLKRSCSDRDDPTTYITARFLSQLITLQVTELLFASEVISLLLQYPTDANTMTAIDYMKTFGSGIEQEDPGICHVMFDRLIEVLQNACLDRRTRYAIENAFHIRKYKFANHLTELECLHPQTPHPISAEDCQDAREVLDEFIFDPNFAENETAYFELDMSSEESGGKEGGMARAPAPLALSHIERHVCMALQSEGYTEAADTLLGLETDKAGKAEMCRVLLDRVAHSASYDISDGLMCARLCRQDQQLRRAFEQTIRDAYSRIREFENTANLACFVSHLFASNAIAWHVLSPMRLTAETSEARLGFIQKLFEELEKSMGVDRLSKRVAEPKLHSALSGILPRDRAENARFAVAFFTRINLSAITANLCEWLENRDAAGERREHERRREQRHAGRADWGGKGDRDSRKRAWRDVTENETRHGKQGEDRSNNREKSSCDGHGESRHSHRYDDSWIHRDSDRSVSSHHNKKRGEEKRSHRHRRENAPSP